MSDYDATGLDHTWWRKYENHSSRWTSPDPYEKFRFYFLVLPPRWGRVGVGVVGDPSPSPYPLPTGEGNGTFSI